MKRKKKKEFKEIKFTNDMTWKFSKKKKIYITWKTFKENNRIFFVVVVLYKKGGFVRFVSFELS